MQVAYAVAVPRSYAIAVCRALIAGGAAVAIHHGRRHPAPPDAQSGVNTAPALNVAVLALYATVVGIRRHVELAALFDTDTAQVPAAAYVALLLLAGLWATAAICADRDTTPSRVHRGAGLLDRRRHLLRRDRRPGSGRRAGRSGAGPDR